MTSAGEYPQAGTAAGASRVLHLPASGRWALLGLDGPAGFQFEFDLMDGPVADTLAAPPTEHPALVRRPA
ncbi:MAG: hypothetical protein Q8K58_12895 [Acidimicrobiales bacterium]|nr:hypothetical protein [Acidimicrobiales bacterium]